ncbi:MAG: hypothetical protein ACTHJ5_05115 [Ilyomonas sp.]
MERIKYTFFCLLFLASFKTNAANDTTLLQLEMVKKISGNFLNLYVDNLKNYYLQTSPNQLTKFNNEGDSVASFNDVKRYGNIYAVDVTNPLKILISYKDFATIIIADRFLSKANTVDLRNADIYEAQAVALSYDNNFWVFDELDSKLKKIDDNGNVIFESTDFRLLFPEAPNISTIIDNNGQLYLYDEKTGWYIFDYYGALKTRLPFIGWKDVSASDNVLYGRNGAFLYAYHPKQLQFKTYKTNLPSSVKVITKNGFYYALTNDGLIIYKISQQL